MLESFSLKFTDGQSPIQLPGPGVTVFVGPNNSGKSLVLRELQAALSSGQQPLGQKMLADFDVLWPTMPEVEREIERWSKIVPPTSQGVAQLPVYSDDGDTKMQGVNVDALRHNIVNHQNQYYVTAAFWSAKIARLDGRTRFALTNDRATGDLIGVPANILARLFIQDSLRAEVRHFIHDAFGLYFVIDPLNGGQLRIRLSEIAPSHNEQSLDQAARDFHSRATYIKDASDGIQAYVGIVAAAVSGQYRLIMIDEPEAFLYPPLARKLGRHLTKITNKALGGLLASTHSADFLMGCIQESHSVRVVRLEYVAGRSRARIVDSDTLDELLRNPLMRSSNVVSALFYDGVIVTESDNDRALYAEVYYRLAATEAGYPDVLFLNGRGKHTIPNFIAPLRRFGIPAAAIADIDVVKDGGKEWTTLLKAAQLPDVMHGSLGVQRGDLMRRFENSGKDMKRDGGVSVLQTDDQQAAHQLFDTLDRYGIFTVRIGELENWLAKLGAQGGKTDWTISALGKMGSDPASESYVRPTGDDVWAFLQKIAEWIRSPARLGTG